MLARSKARNMSFFFIVDNKEQASFFVLELINMEGCLKDRPITWRLVSAGLVGTLQFLSATVNRGNRSAIDPKNAVVWGVTAGLAVRTFAEGPAAVTYVPEPARLWT